MAYSLRHHNMSTASSVIVFLPFFKPLSRPYLTPDFFSKCELDDFDIVLDALEVEICGNMPWFFLKLSRKNGLYCFINIDKWRNARLSMRTSISKTGPTNGKKKWRPSPILYARSMRLLMWFYCHIYTNRCECMFQSMYKCEISMRIQCFVPLTLRIIPNTRY